MTPEPGFLERAERITRLNLRRSLTRLDEQPSWAAALAGVLFGALAVTALAFGSAVWAYALFGAAALSVVALLHGSHPVLVEDRLPDPERIRPDPSPIAPTPKPPVDPEPHRPMLPGVRWVRIPAGTFRMGSDEEVDEQPVHTVSISAFDCMHAPVTRGQYRTVMGQDPAWPGGGDERLPVNLVSWFDAVRFCNAWSERDGLDPCYDFRGDDVTWHADRRGYRLLTEAEWEFVCRAGSTTRWSHGDHELNLVAFAWFAANAGSTVRPVAAKQANGLGLHDLHGNVWEWVADWFGRYSADNETDPIGPPTGSDRTLRGGAFVSPATDLRSARRARDLPASRNSIIGFRCALGRPRQY